MDGELQLDAVMREVREVMRTVPGIGKVYDQPPEQLTSFPCAIVYSVVGNARIGTADGGDGKPRAWLNATIRIDCWVARQDLPYDIIRAMPFTWYVPIYLLAGFFRDRFNQTVVTLGDPNVRGSAGGTGPVRYELLMPEPGGINAVGYRFDLDVTTEEVLPV